MNGFLCAFDAIFATKCLSVSNGILNIVAKIFAPAWTSYKCKGSSTENSKIWGALFKPLQNGLPVSSIMWSAGKAFNNWAIWLLKASWKISTANWTQVAYDFC